jgi:hypothetical protein
MVNHGMIRGRATPHSDAAGDCDRQKSGATGSQTGGRKRRFGGSHAWQRAVTIEVMPCSHRGCVDLRDSRYPDEEVLHFSSAEWAEFLAKAKSGQFDQAPSAADLK